MKFSQSKIDFLKKKFFEASDEVLKIYETSFEVHYKKDKSPLTIADITANEILTLALHDLFPEDFIVSEEIKISKNYKLPDSFWLIDPIDGTKEFVKKTGDFTLNIGYVEKGLPVWGMVYAPIYKELYFGGKDLGIFYEKNGILQEIKKNRNDNEIIALVSRNHISGKEEILLKQLNVTQKIPMGSSLKICKLAINEADIYLRFGETSEWDIAPADALLTVSNGCILTKSGNRLSYGKKNLNNPSFIAFSSHFLNKIQPFDTFLETILENLV